MKTHHNSVMIVLLMISLLVSACGGNAAKSATDTAATDSASGSLNQATELALGILKLEDSTQAVTVEQAEELLTLWQAYQALGNSETTAAVELESLVNQIQASLTTEQADAIDSMNLTSESIAEVMQDLGMNFGLGDPQRADSTPQAGSGSGEFREMPQGGFPGGGTGLGGGVPGSGMRRGADEVPFGDGMGGAMGLQGTPGAMGQNRFSALGSQVNPMVLRVLIQVLEAKIGGTD